jgi:hypothetical protein
MAVMLLDIRSVAIEYIPANAEEPTVVTESGRYSDVIEWQNWKAEDPILTTLLGTVKSLMEDALLKAPLPMDLTVSGMVTSVKLLQSFAMKSGISVNAEGSCRLAREVHVLNTSLPMLSTDSGTTMRGSALHPLKAASPMYL